MSLYLRRMAEQHIEDSKSPLHHLPKPDWFENQILFRAEDDDIGALIVIAADLLELARRADPAYGLTPVRQVTDDVIDR